MHWAAKLPDGRNGNASAWDGMAGRTTPVSNAGVDASFIARTPKWQALATTEDISNTWSLRSKHWRRYQMHSAMPKRLRCCVLESLLSMRCDTAARRQTVWLQCKVSAASDTSESNLGTSLATR